MMNGEWFSVDRAGLAKQLADVPTWRLIAELLQNAWDERSSNVVVKIERSGLRGYWDVVVTDDNPEGFTDLSHAWTLFAPSKKGGDAEKRGRFNLGEKLLLAAAREATISTTTGTVIFSDEGRKVTTRVKRDAGSSVLVTMKIPNIQDTLQNLARLAAPVLTTINGVPMAQLAVVATVAATLPTVTVNGAGEFIRTERKTTVRFYATDDQLPAAIYEMGIPVVDTDMPWSLDVQQKVPLNRDRDNVTPAYLQQLRVLAFNEMAGRMDADDFRAPWARSAAGDPMADAAGVQASLDARFGTKRVAYDPSDLEANRIAVAQGFTVVPGGSMSGGEWQNARATTLPAGQVTPSPKPYSPDGDQLATLKEDELTAGMKRVRQLARTIAATVGIGNIGVTFGNDPAWPFNATFGTTKQLVLNVGCLGVEWFNMATNRVAIFDLLIHEFGHYDGSSHLSQAYYDNLTRMGAQIVDAALRYPNVFADDFALGRNRP